MYTYINIHKHVNTYMCILYMNVTSYGELCLWAVVCNVLSSSYVHKQVCEGVYVCANVRI